MTKKELLHIVRQGETERVEFKTSFNKLVIETLVAFSNTRGGKVLMGVNDEGDYIPKHKNKLLVEAFYLTGDIEKYGTGYRRVNQWLKEYPNLKYELNDKTGFIQLKILSNVTDNRLNRILLLTRCAFRK